MRFVDSLPRSSFRRALVAALALLAVGLAATAAVSSAAVPSFAWAKSAGGTLFGNATSVSALADGSSIITGRFAGTATFGSTPPLTSTGVRDVFVAKVNPDGSFAWAKSAGGASLNGANSVSALADGSSFITGNFAGTITFGSTPPLTSLGSNDVFIAKVNPDGSFAWAKRAGGTSNDYANSVSALADGSSIITGQFTNTATFGSTPPLTGAGTFDVFIAKVNPDGSFAWATSAGGTGEDIGYGVSALADGTSIVTGLLSDTVTFGSTPPLTSAGGYDVFVAKVNPDGSFAWARRAGDTGRDNATSVSALADGSSIITGRFTGTNTFGSTPPLTSAGSDDVFVAKVNTDGSFAWAKSAGGTGSDWGQSVSALADGSSIITGPAAGTVTFGAISSVSNGGFFVAKANADGSFAWAKRAEAFGGSGVSALADGSSIITGNFSGTATFESTTPLTSDVAAGFVAKVNIDVLSVPIAPVAPIAVAGDARAEVLVTPLADPSITAYTVTASTGGGTCTVTAPATSCVVTGLINGTSYTFTATATNATGTSEASAASNAVMPTAPSSPSATTPATPASIAVLSGRNYCKAQVCTTSGRVPEGATRVVQIANGGRSQMALGAHTSARVTTTCKITTTGSTRTYTCKARLGGGKWTLTTQAKAGARVIAQSVKHVRVRAAKRTAVTG
jgi:hypothetical protein